MTPTAIQRLREAIRWERAATAEHARPDAPTFERPCHACAKGYAVTDNNIAAVERELAAKDAEIAELRRTCPDCGSPMPGEMCAVCALLYAQAEIAEIRELVERVSARGQIVSTLDIADLAAVLLICAPDAEKARAEAPK